VLERHGLDRELASDIGERIAAGAFTDAFGLVSEAMIDAFCIAGERERVAERMAEVLDTADSFVVGSPLGPDLDVAIDLAAAAARSIRE
jgi:5,10-methylenetetrahydromethanopterin reductase